MISTNQSHFFLEIEGLPTDEFLVQRCASQDYALSHSFYFRIEALAQSEWDTNKLCGLSAKFMIDIANKTYLYGMIAKCVYLGPNYDNQTFAYQITLASPLEFLKHRQSPRIFLNKTVKEIIQEILKNIGWPETCFSFDLHEIYPSRMFTLQLNESDFDFMQRISSQSGLGYYFLQNADNWQLIFFDNNTQLLNSGIALPFYEHGKESLSPNIYHFSEKVRLLPQTVHVRNYDYHHPDQLLSATKQNSTTIPGRGTHDSYGDNLCSQEDANFHTKILLEHYDCQRQQFIAETDSVFLHPGQCFTLENHPNADYNTTYLVIAAEIRGEQNQSGSIILPTFHSQMRLIKATMIYRPERKTRPPFHHIIPAIIESKNDYAYLDEQGRYRVRFPFDQSNLPLGEASCPIRLLQTHGGQHKNEPYGMHFPLRSGTQVAVGFIQGDLDRPVILGVMPNPENPTTVKDTNVSQNVVRTFTGNELTFEDKKQNAYTQLATKDHKNRLRLDATDNNHQIELRSEEGMLNAYAKKTLHIKTGDSYMQTTEGDHFTSVARSHLLMTKKQNISQRANQDLLATAGQNLQLKSEGETIITAAKDMQISAGNNFSAQIRHAPLQMQTEHNDIRIQSDGDLIFHSRENGTAILGQPMGGITLTPGGNVLLQGPQVKLEAEQINIYGTSVANHGANTKYVPPPQLSPSQPKNKKKDEEDEFKLFVATVYGEASGCSETAWKAVGSVIVNRLSCKEYKKYKNITEIIQNTRFQAYDDQSPNFLLAKSYLDKISTLKPKRIDEMIAALKPVYYNYAVNTDADHYYSPKAQHRGHQENKNKYHNDVPNWVTRGLRDGTYIEVKVPGLNPTIDDFVFLKTIK